MFLFSQYTLFKRFPSFIYIYIYYTYIYYIYIYKCGQKYFPSLREYRRLAGRAKENRTNYNQNSSIKPEPRPNLKN